VLVELVKPYKKSFEIMIEAKRHKFEIWCQFMMSKNSQNEVHNFFRRHFFIDNKYLIHNMHVTIYHSRRPMIDLKEVEAKCNYSLDTNETRFMVLAPGGENPHPDLIPAYRKVGIRIKKGTDIRKVIDDYRTEVLKYENNRTLGNRKPSNRSRNAFGSRYFQPHISILKAGSGIISDLSKVGESFRDYVHELHFDKYIIRRRVLEL
jgi:hypothetical protein